MQNPFTFYYLKKKNYNRQLLRFLTFCTTLAPSVFKTLKPFHKILGHKARPDSKSRGSIPIKEKVGHSIFEKVWRHTFCQTNYYIITSCVYIKWWLGFFFSLSGVNSDLMYKWCHPITVGANCYKVFQNMCP